MRAFLRWALTVVRHWILLGGGAFVSVALLVWGQYAREGSGHIPSIVWWSGVVVGFVGACFLSWRNEAATVAQLATTRPEYAHKQAGIEQLRRPDGGLIERYQAKFTFDNTGGIPSDEFTSRVIAIRDFKQAPEDGGYHTLANRAHGQVSIRTDVMIVPYMPAHYFAVYIDYKDSRTGVPYSQTMFYFWSGSGLRDFDMSFRDCMIEEQKQMLVYFAAREISLSRYAAGSE